MTHRTELLILVAAGLLTGCGGYDPGRLHVAAPPVIPRPADHLRAELFPANAGDVTIDPADGLSPEEAALMAVDQNPRLVAIRAERGIAAAELVAAGVLPNPRLELSVEAPYGSADQTVVSYGAGVAWDIGPLLSRGRRRASARAGSTSVDLEVAWQEWQLAQAARMAAVRVIYLERRVAVARTIETAWSDRVASLRTALARHAVTELDVAGAAASLADSRLARMDLEQEVAAARSDLNAAIGLDPRADLRVDATWRVPATRPSLDQLLLDLPTRRLDLVALRFAYRSADETMRADAIARFPALDVGVTVGRDVDGVTAAGVVVAFDVPLLDRRQGELGVDRARRTQLEAEYDARLYETRAQVARIAGQLELVDAKLIATTEARDAARRFAELARSAAVAGLLSSVLAADLEQRAYSVELRVIELEQAQAELWVALAAAAG